MKNRTTSSFLQDETKSGDTEAFVFIDWLRKLLTGLV